MLPNIRPQNSKVAVSSWKMYGQVMAVFQLKDLKEADFFRILFSPVAETLCRSGRKRLSRVGNTGKVE
jgi:hypothetical protein